MTITLKREEADPNGLPGDRGSWPVTVSAFYDTAMTQPAKIFVYQRAGLGSSLNGDSLSCVADVLNMNEVPEDAPTSDTPYYRIAVASVICRSQAHAQEFWQELVAAVRTLVDETAASTVISTTEILTIAP